MKTQSAKAKGRRLQQWFRDLLVSKLGIHKEDIESRSMGAGGEDLIMARSARQKFPYSIECKNQEKINIWESYKQANENSKDYEPVVVLKRNNLNVQKITTQNEFLKKMGILERAEILSKRMSFKEKSDLYFRLKRLLNPDYM